MRWISRCPVCACERLAIFKICWNCGTPAGTDMACNPCQQVPCPHCDTDPFDPQTCNHCAAIHYGTVTAAKVLNTRPAPDHHVLHDMADPDSPTGAHGRCRRCGGRNYVTDTGPWCPRAFCDADA